MYFPYLGILLFSPVWGGYTYPDSVCLMQLDRAKPQSLSLPDTRRPSKEQGISKLLIVEKATPSH